MLVNAEIESNGKSLAEKAFSTAQATSSEEPRPRFNSSRGTPVAETNVRTVMPDPKSVNDEIQFQLAGSERYVHHILSFLKIH